MDFLWVPLVKFVHVVTAAGLLGAIMIVFFHGAKGESNAIPARFSLKNALILATVLAGMTGLLLVSPKHFTFHTPWIQVAIAGVLVLCSLLIVFFPISPGNHRHRTRLLCLVMIALIVVIIHDAVTKSTFFSSLTLS